MSLHRRQPDRSGKVMIQPSMRSLACTELIMDRDTAIARAEQEAASEKQYRYVIPYEEGFLVLSTSDVYQYFEVGKENEAVFKADPPKTKK